MTSEDANFALTLIRRARTQRHVPALIEPAGRGRWRGVDYAALSELVTRYANGFARLGIQRGERVLYLLRPSVRGFAAFYALLRLGAVPVFVDPRMPPRKLLHCISESRPQILLGVPLAHALSLFLIRRFPELRLRVTDGRRWLWGGGRLSDCDAGAEQAEPGITTGTAVSFLAYTSGSTGPPKAVRSTHEILCHQARIMAEVCGWRPGMKAVMCYGPFTPYALADGLTVILPSIDFTRPAAADPCHVARAVNEHGAQCAFAAPIVWMNLVRAHGLRPPLLPTLEHAITAGAAAHFTLHQQLLPRLHPAARLHTPYGATEAMPITTTHSGELLETWDASRRGYGTCVGRPLSGIAVRVIRVSDSVLERWNESLCVPGDEVGELVVRGGIVSESYPFDATQTAMSKIASAEGTWHRTGDLGRVDDEGRVWFCGRVAQRLPHDGGFVGADAVENIYNGHPHVFRTAAVPNGNSVALCVEMQPGRRFTTDTRRELLALAEGTPFASLIRHVLPHRGFPVDARHNSKILRGRLAEWARQQCARS